MPAAKGNKHAVGNKGGRPSLYKEEYTEQAYKLALLGATDKQIADFFGITEACLTKWKKKHDEFVSSLKKGKLIADASIADKLYQRALGYSHPEDKIFNDNGKPLIVPTTKHYPPDPTSMIFWLKNRVRDKWRERQDVANTFDFKNLSQLSEEQLDVIVEKLIAQQQNQDNEQE